LRRVEEGVRRLAATIVHCYDKPIKDIELARSDHVGEAEKNESSGN